MRHPKRKSIFAVVHCEFGGSLPHPYVDEALFHVASSLSAAEKYIKIHFVDPFSWWRIQEFRIDDPNDEQLSSTVYTHTGRQVRRPPFKYALHYYKRHLAAHGHGHVGKSNV